ncbi:MAG TPA: FAD-linked oxidase C-terminal domain-containing protein [Candidatus Saccharimonadia bacterium]|nr:FAD-linked oxidase C-terminal domain-containing protein [Candidatus Saccharimonadia bacterium]
MTMTSQPTIDTGRPAGTAFLDELRVLLPEMTLLIQRDETAAFRYDETEYTYPGWPLAVALPRTTAEIATIVTLAARHLVPIVPRGAGSGLSGGATAVDGALTLVTTKMDRILEIDTGNLAAVVQPGVINADLGRAAAKHGLFYAPDPASFEVCTIGGNLAENSGGLRCVKYGVTRDAVLGLEVVLADGSVIRTGGGTVKDVAGYDLTHLFVGSEGTLGIITEATLRLRPMPAEKLTVLAFFASVAAAGDAVARITAAGIVPVTLELMDRFTIRAVDDAANLGLDRDAGALLMIESDAGGAAAADELDRAERACTEAGATSLVRAKDPTEADWLRQARRAAHSSLERAGVARMDDVGVPRSRVPEMLAAIERISAAHDLAVGVFGHAGDGNLHPTFVVDRDDPTAESRINTARAAIYQAAIDLGGTITGEHGTGIAKRAFLEAQLGSRAIEVMRSLKAALDPQGILNPGKVL